MLVSLVLATIHRTDEVVRLFDSLVLQSYSKFEVVVVDQNKDDRLVDIISSYSSKLTIKHTRSSSGLSRARNAGLKFVQGEIVAFPDDDCWYQVDTIERVVRFFSGNSPVDGLTGCFENEIGLSEGRWPKKTLRINKRNVWNTSISFSIFLRYAVIKEVGEFDESLGVGSGTIWGSGEETDYLIRALKLGFHLVYDPDLVLKHPVKVAEFDEKAILRARLYSPGTGRVLKKNQLGYVALVMSLAKCSLRVLYSLITLQWSSARFYLVIVRGRVRGWSS